MDNDTNKEMKESCESRLLYKSVSFAVIFQHSEFN